MTRIDELAKNYPSIPREVIIKHEVINVGIRDTNDLDKVSIWKAPLGSYQSYDHDLTLQDLAEKTPWRVKPGYVMRPVEMYFSSGIGAQIHRDTRSPYSIREVSEGKFGLFEGEQRIDADLYFPLPKQEQREQAVTSKGTPVNELVEIRRRRCFRISPTRYCEYFYTGEECKFCNYNASQGDIRSIGIDRRITINLEDTVEAYKILSSQSRFVEGLLESGGFISTESEGKIYLRFVEKIASAAPYKPVLKIVGEAMERKDYERLKEAGLDSVTLQMEVWDERLFPVIAPGKAKHMPRERWIEAFLDAVDIFGPGHVAGKFVAGVTMVPQNGFKTLEEARDSHIEGNTWCAKNGIWPAFTPLRWAPGSPFSKDPTNREKLPPTEYILDLAVAHHEAMTQYGLYDKLDRFLYCGFECTYPYIGEIGMLEKAGDIGTWMSAVVPDELNWLAQFVASTRSPAQR